MFQPDGFEPIRTRLGIAYQDDCIEIRRDLAARLHYRRRCRAGATRSSCSSPCAILASARPPVNWQRRQIGLRAGPRRIAARPRGGKGSGSACVQPCRRNGPEISREGSRRNSHNGGIERVKMKLFFQDDRGGFGMRGGVMLAALAGLATIPAAAPAQTGGRARPPKILSACLTTFTNFGKADPDRRTATAVVNGFVITGTDIDQRVALVTSASEAPNRGRRTATTASAGAAQSDRRNAQGTSGRGG